VGRESQEGGVQTKNKQGIATAEELSRDEEKGGGDYQRDNIGRLEWMIVGFTLKGRVIVRTRRRQ